jgi:hypothetical protein
MQVSSPAVIADQSGLAKAQARRRAADARNAKPATRLPPGVR